MVYRVAINIRPSIVISLNAGHVGIVDMPQYSDAASGCVVSAFAAYGLALGGVTANRLGAFHIPVPLAGSWGNALVLGSATAYECGAKTA